MKLLSFPKKKKIVYFGIEIVVPIWAKFIATEDDGAVLVFESKPVVMDESDKPYGLVIWNNPDADEFEKVATVDLEGMDWKQTLVAI